MEAKLLKTALAAVLLLSAGCRTHHTSVAADVDPDRWSRVAELAIPNTDTLTHCDLSLYLRFDGRFLDDTLTLRIEVRTPDSLSYEEPFLFCVSHDRRPAALHGEAVARYRRGVLFARRGDYRLRIVPARTVRGVEAVGLYIERE